MQNYEANDKICIFGFSRGAYTARALAGMLHKVGLLPRCNHQQVPFAYAMLCVTCLYRETGMRIHGDVTSVLEMTLRVGDKALHSRRPSAMTLV